MPDKKIINFNNDCNIINKPVYGGTIVAGRHARIIVSPHGCNPLDQRPSLVVTALPDALRTPKAIAYWQQLYDEGLVDHECISIRGRVESALMAQRLGHALRIQDLWKVFEQLWGMSNLRGTLGKALDTQLGWDCKAILDTIFGKEE